MQSNSVETKTAIKIGWMHNEIVMNLNGSHHCGKRSRDRFVASVHLTISVAEWRRRRQRTRQEKVKRRVVNKYVVICIWEMTVGWGWAASHRQLTSLWLVGLVSARLTFRACAPIFGNYCPNLIEDTKLQFWSMCVCTMKLVLRIQ